MEIYPISRVTPGDRLARPIYGPGGRLLLSEGHPLTGAEIERLVELGVRAVYIDDGRGEQIRVDELVREETRAEAAQALADAYDRIARSVTLRIDELRRASMNLLDEVLHKAEPIVRFVEVRTLGDHTLGHSVSVCLLALIVGRRMGLGYSELKDLGIGALLHDVGRASIPPSTWFKEGPLSEEEWEEVREHPRRGYDTLRSSRELRVLTAHVAFQHHERLDGSGYPRGIAGEEIHLYARITAVCDTYDALTQERPYRPALPPHHALRYLESAAGRQFDADAVHALLRTVAPFPIGTRVLLEDGRSGVVDEVRPASLARPILRLADGKRVDLATNPSRIVKVISGWGIRSPEDLV